MEKPDKGDYTDELYKKVVPLVEKMNALENLTVVGTGVTGKITYAKGQWTLEINLLPT